MNQEELQGMCWILGMVERNRISNQLYLDEHSILRGLKIYSFGLEVLSRWMR
jgi:hypothetical protein